MKQVVSECETGRKTAVKLCNDGTSASLRVFKQSETKWKTGQ